MASKKLRVNYGTGTKLMVLRDDGIPQTFDGFKQTMRAKVTALSSVDLESFSFKYMDVDGSTVVDLEEDDDVQMMFDSADSIVVIVSGIGSTSERSTNAVQNSPAGASLSPTPAAPPSPPLSDIESPHPPGPSDSRRMTGAGRQANTSRNPQKRLLDGPPVRTTSSVALTNVSEPSPLSFPAEDPAPRRIPRRPALNTPLTAKNAYAADPNELDEINVNAGDIIVIKVAHDDGWAIGVNVTRSGEAGAFPYEYILTESSTDSTTIDPPASEDVLLDRAAPAYTSAAAPAAAREYSLGHLEDAPRRAAPPPPAMAPVLESSDLGRQYQQTPEFQPQPSQPEYGRQMARNSTDASQSKGGNTIYGTPAPGSHPSQLTRNSTDASQAGNQMYGSPVGFYPTPPAPFNPATQVPWGNQPSPSPPSTPQYAPMPWGTPPNQTAASPQYPPMPWTNQHNPAPGSPQLAPMPWGQQPNPSPNSPQFTPLYYQPNSPLLVGGSSFPASRSPSLTNIGSPVLAATIGTDATLERRSSFDPRASATVTDVQSIRSTLSTDAQGPTTDRIRFTLTGAEYSWHLAWKNERTARPEDLLGALGRVEWGAQRGWGYKQIQNDPTYWFLKYVPREQDWKKNPSLGFVQFTIFYNDKTLFSAANSKLREKIDTMHPTNFVSEFVERLRAHKDTRNVVTEWACIEPPEAFAGPSTGRGDLHFAYIVRQQGDALSDQAAKVVYAWVKKMLVSGDWAKAKAAGNFKVARG